jgi:hypothetical protein
MRKLVSVKKLEANRKNAERSTGPKTVEGKNKVRWNSLKHGLLAKAAILPQEDRAEYERLLAGLAEHYQPVDMLEALHVEEIACIYWRLRRTLRVETAKIERNMKRVDTAMQSTLSDIQRHAEVTRSISTLCTTAAGLRRLIEVFDDIAREIQQDGKLSEVSFEWVKAAGFLYVEELDVLSGATTVTDAARQEAFESLLGVIAEMKKMFRGQIKVREAEEAALRDTTIACAGILEDSTGEAIRRYEGPMKKQLDMAIARLERLQRQRRGQTVQPTRHVDVAKTA